MGLEYLEEGFEYPWRRVGVHGRGAGIHWKGVRGGEWLKYRAKVGRLEYLGEGLEYLRREGFEYRRTQINEPMK